MIRVLLCWSVPLFEIHPEELVKTKSDGTIGPAQHHDGHQAVRWWMEKAYRKDRTPIHPELLAISS